MAKIKGKLGVIHVGSDAIANLRSYSVDRTGDTTQSTVMGEDWHTHEATINGWTGTADALWDSADANGQGALQEGSTVALTFYPEGVGSGLKEYTGNAIVNGVVTRAEYEGMVEASFTFQGTGPLTEGTQT